MKLIDLVGFNCNDDDKILIARSDRSVVIESTCLSSDLEKYYYCNILYIGVSNDLGTNLLVIIDD